MKKKRIITIVIIATVLVLAFGAFFVFKPFNKQSSGEKTYTVIKEVYENVIEISGTVEAAESQTLQVAGAGTVEAVYVNEGDIVKEGDVILDLNKSEQQYNLEKHDYDIEQKKINGSTREVELMETQRDMLLEKFEDRQVVAMFDGIIADLDVSEGDVLESKDGIGTLINRDYLKATIEVVETDVSSLKIGQKVYLTFPAYEKGVVEGKVLSWPSVARVSNSGATVVDVEIIIENPPIEILPNYSFIGEIEISPTDEMLLVESSAIGKDDAGMYVTVINRDGSTEKRSVEAKMFSRTHMQIISGLSEGEIVAAQGNLLSGMDPDLISDRMQLKEGMQNNNAIQMGGSMPMGSGMMGGKSR